MTPHTFFTPSRKLAIRNLAIFVALLSGLTLLVYILLHPMNVQNLKASHFSWDMVGATLPPDGSVCGDYVPEHVPDWNEVIASPPLRPSGIAVSTLEGNIKTIGYRTYKIDENQQFLGRFYIWYPNTELNNRPLNIKLLALLDEKQISNTFMDLNSPFLLNQDSLDLTLTPGENKSIQVKLPNLINGVHDLAILILYNTKDEPDNRGIINFTAMRYSLLSGIPRKSEELVYTALLSKASGNGLSLLMSLEDNEPSTWNWPESTLRVSTTQKQLGFYVWLGNIVFSNSSTNKIPTLHDQPAALLFFINYHLVNKFISNPVQYVTIPGNSKYSVLGNMLNIPSEKGRYDILVVRINYPQIPVCLLQGDRNGFGFAFDINLQRVSIIIG